MKWFIFLSLVWSVEGFGGNSFGNGGHAVVCRGTDGLIMSAEALDLFEMKAVYGYALAPIQGTGFLGRDVVVYLDRMLPYSPIRTKTYASFALLFESEMHLTPKSLGIVPDYGDAVLPVGCTLEQAVIQWDYVEAETKKFRYLINETIWMKLNTESRQALVLHEIIYRELIDYRKKFGDVYTNFPEVNSKKVRQLVASILSDRLLAEPVADIKKFFYEEFPFSESEGALAYLKSPIPPFVYAPRDGEEAYVCRMTMQDSLVLYRQQWLQTAERSFYICFYEQVWHGGSRIRSVNIKKGQTFRGILNQRGVEFDFRAEEFEAGKGMEVVTTSQSLRGNLLQVGPFEAISLQFGNTRLPVTYIKMDSDFSFHWGTGELGVAIYIESATKIKRPHFEIELVGGPYALQEFYGIDQKSLLGARRLEGSGRAIWKGKWRSFKDAIVMFSPDEKISSLCEVNSYGGQKCWKK